jgi:hypothetical protein
MFERFVHGSSAEFITIVAFIFASSIFVAISWRALRMKRSQIEHFANLPFTTETPAARHEAEPARPIR